MKKTADVIALQGLIVDALEDVKGKDIVVFDTEHLSALFERVIIVSGSSNRQTKALASSVRDQLRDAGYQDAEELRAAWCSVNDLKDGGYNSRALKKGGFGAEDLIAGGFNPKDMRDGGFAVGELKAAGMTADKLREAGFAAEALKSNDYSCDELVKAGFTAGELAKANF